MRVTHQLFFELEKLAKDPGTRAYLASFGNNKFPKELRFRNGLLVVKGKTTMSYDIGSIPTVEALSTVETVLGNLYAKAKVVQKEEAKSIDENDFSSMDAGVQHTLIHDYCMGMSSDRRYEYRDTVYTGLFIKAILPSDVLMGGGKIEKIKGVEAGGEGFVLTNLHKASASHSLRSPTTSVCARGSGVSPAARAF